MMEAAGIEPAKVSTGRRQLCDTSDIGEMLDASLRVVPVSLHHDVRDPNVLAVRDLMPVVDDTVDGVLDFTVRPPSQLRLPFSRSSRAF
jgi:hypothetical protein